MSNACKATMIRGGTKKQIFFVFVLYFLFSFPSHVFCGEPTDPVDNATCFSCHGDPSSDPYIDPERFKASAHGKSQCISCHPDIKETPHDTPLKPVVCSNCHRAETESYVHSDHGKALKSGAAEAAACQTCHGSPHELRNALDPQSSVYRKNIPQTCARCHEKTQEMEKFNLDIKEPVSSYIKSVHGITVQKDSGAQVAVCTDCHGSHGLNRATNPASKLYWRNIPSTCGQCHADAYTAFTRSVHGKSAAAGKREAPVCTDCHGEHSIDAVAQMTSKVSPAHISGTCGQCHAAERITTKYGLPNDAVDTFMQSYHGLVMQRGSVTAAHCASCHGVHDILPSTDPNSSVYPGNLEQTCSKCHAGVSAQVAKGKIHASKRPGAEDKANAFVRWFYVTLIFIVIGFLFVHNCFDFARKLKIHYQKMRSVGKPGRMSVNERVQHFILFGTFVALAYTGFALRFPQAWWAVPFLGKFDWRGLGHRAAAIVFCALAAYHVFYLLFTKKGRWQLNALWLRKKDFVQCGQAFAYYAGRRKDRPVFGFYSYIEKFEYWALVWGSLIMAVTGFLMMQENWFLSYFPKWLYDVMAAIHYYEAILACLAIVVWHGYFVIFDPDVYPSKWTWVSGRGSGEDARRDES